MDSVAHKSFIINTAFVTVQETIVSELCWFVADLNVPDCRTVNKSICTSAENIQSIKHHMRFHSLELKVVYFMCNGNELVSISKFAKGSSVWCAPPTFRRRTLRYCLCGYVHERVEQPV